MNIPSSASPLVLGVFIVLSLLIVLLHAWQGWRQGPIRQALRILAIASAYFVAWFGGRLATPLLQPFMELPGFMVSIVAGVLLGLLWYAGVTGVSAILFKKTSNQDSGLVRFTYGVTGAMLGVVFGLVLVWVIVIGIRLTGSVAQSRVAAEREMAREAHPNAPPAPSATEKGWPGGLIRLKESLEIGPAEDVMAVVDPIPQRVYDTLGKITRVAASPALAQRLLDYPGAKALADHPKIKALSQDPEITRELEQKQFLALLRHPRLIDAANDESVKALAKAFDLENALDHALETRH